MLVQAVHEAPNWSEHERHTRSLAFEQGVTSYSVAWHGVQSPHWPDARVYLLGPQFVHAVALHCWHAPVNVSAQYMHSRFD